MSAAERRDLERRLRALGIHCPPGTLEPLTQDARLTRGPVMAGRIRRSFTPPQITVR